MTSIVLALWIFMCGIELVVPKKISVKSSMSNLNETKLSTYGTLQYWVRDPGLDKHYRRNNPEPSKDRPPLNRIQDKNEKNLGENKITKLNPRLQTKTFTPKTKASSINAKKILTPNYNKSLRMGFEHSEPWPRVHNHKTTKYMLRSTRMMSNEYVPFADIPLQEVQHQEKKVKPKEGDENKKPTKVLRPYTLRDQLEKLSIECTDGTTRSTANITLEVLGRTIEYNDLIMLKATEPKSESDRHFRADGNKYEDDVPEKKIVFIVHGLSAMGIHNIPCLTVVRRLEQLISYYFNHLDKFDIFLIPVANPDGYGTAIAYGIQGANSWSNKNNSPQSVCNGVALDRNFDVAWNDSGSKHSCSPQYPGPKAFSEPETRVIRDVLNRYGHKIVAYIHVHASSYDSQTKKGDAVLYPKGYSETQSEDDKYIDLKGEIEEAMKNASFKYLSVNVDTLHSWYGKVSGTSVDYASTIYGIPYALEFLMQPYDSFMRFSERYKYPNDKLSQAALEHVWKRVIDATFNTIHRNIEKSND